ncbi:MAG: AsmA family protein, partial [Acidobacteriota bacterium]|nr:AsmA family protein [Acidobacteriota bacterium]
MTRAEAVPAPKIRRRTAQAIALGVILLIAAGIAAPYMRADSYRDRIRVALETALARKVTVGDVRLNLFTGPGFQVDDVVISDDPALGSEPFAYVPTLRATPRIWSLWTGRLEFASVSLDEAHVNLARVMTPAADGEQEIRWNFEPLLRPGILQAFPHISLRSARINFKAGSTKSTFYLINADLDIAPPSSHGGDWRVQFRGEPARSDRPAFGSGSFQAQGRWRQNGNLELDLQLKKSEIADMSTLINGEEIGVHGLISGQAHVAGPVNSLG